MKSDELFREALNLPADVRADLAAELIASLDGPEDRVETVEALWVEEIRRRCDDIDSGRTKTIPWSDVRARLFAKFRPA